MTDFPKFDDEYVDKLEISVTSRNFKIYGSDGATRDLTCDSVDEFVDLLNEHFVLHSKTDKEAITEELQDMWFDTYNHILIGAR